MKGVNGFDLEKAYEAVLKDATVSPMNDQTTSCVPLIDAQCFTDVRTRYFDREEVVPFKNRFSPNTSLL